MSVLSAAFLLASCAAPEPRTPLELALAGVRDWDAGRVDRAQERLREACTLGHGGACHRLAGLPGTPDARPLQERACALDVAAACWALAQAGGAGEETWGRRACEAGFADPCLAAAQAFPSDGRVLLARGCDLGDARACWRLGLMLESEPQGLVLLERACALDGAWGCQALGDARWSRGEVEAARDAYARGCGIRPTHASCGLAAQVVEDSEAGTACAEGSDAACRAACTAGHAASCVRGEAAWAAACSTGDARACTLLGTAAARGTIDARPEQATAWLWEGCGLHDAWGCVRLAEVVESGRGPLPARSRGDVRWLRNQACDLQLDYACAPHERWLEPTSPR